jgi:hypothetical protein
MVGTHVRSTSIDVGQWEAEDPEEVFARPPPDMGPERRLRWDVFVDGIQLVMGARGGKGNRKEIREAAQWILSLNRKDAFSFEILAEDFGLEPSALRRKLRENFALEEKAQKPTLARTRT